jgi:outer membrane lipoprotein-sorting protein
MLENRPHLSTAMTSAASAMIMILAVAANAAAPEAKPKPDVKPKAVAAEPQVPKLTPAQIVERHVAARGGEQAWKSVKTLQMTGKMEVGRGDNIQRAEKMANAPREKAGRATTSEVVAANAAPENKQIQLPFTLDLKRPNLMRLEIEFNGKTAVQVYDGHHGWKYRPFLNRNMAEPFTANELNAEAARGELDGPLIDSAAKGTKVELEGSDLVDKQPAYRLKVTPKGSPAKHIWIDAKTFLDVKVEGVPQRMDGKMHSVYVYQRDFRAVQGVQIPFTLETQIDGYPDSHKTLVEKAAVNPTLDNTAFSEPHA